MKNLTVLLLVPFMIQSVHAQDPANNQGNSEQTGESRQFINPALFLKTRKVEQVQPAERMATLPGVTPPDYYRALQDEQASPVVPEADRQENANQINRPIDDNPLAKVTIQSDAEGALSDQLPEDYAFSVYGDYSQATLAPELRQVDYVWSPRTVCWQAPNFYHWPLYFEDEGAERYGHCVSRFPVAHSAAHFFTSAFFLPYNCGVHEKCERRYALGYLRPGSCNPLCGNRIPLSARGLSYMAIKTGATMAILP